VSTPRQVISDPSCNTSGMFQLANASKCSEMPKKTLCEQHYVLKNLRHTERKEKERINLTSEKIYSKMVFKHKNIRIVDNFLQ
jgi:hypothetical protein